MTKSYPIEFGPDKSQIVRAFAIIFMIALHQDTLGEFKICVPIFTFLVGYGYAFAKRKNLKHVMKRSWHLLSHFWLILLGIFLPVAILSGGYKPSIGDVLLNMFGLESNLNWYSWYIYFYIFAMIIMIPASRTITQYKLWGVLMMIIVSVIGAVGFHSIPNWSDNVWSQAGFDCFLCSPCLYSGFYLAEGGVVTKINIRHDPYMLIVLCLVMITIFFLRGLPYVCFLDFVTIPIFVIALVAIFNIIDLSPINKFFVAIGKQSMNMWFIHALFATSVTSAVFAPLINWIEPKLLMIIIITVASYCMGKIIESIYETIRL